MGANDATMIRFAEGKQSLGKVTNKAVPWKSLVVRLLRESRTNEIFAQYLKEPKAEQDRLKNTNGYWIGCPCKDGRRKKVNLEPRYVVTLDLDNLSKAMFAAICKNTTALRGYEHVFHTTRKHTADAPRVRIIILCSRPITPEEYERISRVLAHFIDPTMEAIDDVSYRPAQMMFWPSCSRDSEFVREHFEGKPLDPDKMLGLWKAKHKRDPFNYTELPYAESQGQKRLAAAKAEDPWEKEGIVGAFCRQYPIEEAIGEFLGDFYAPGDMSGPKPRYSYLGGSTTNGIEIQDDGRFMYSHHSTDPCSDMLVNSWDAVRLCLYGREDDAMEDDTPIGKRPSFKAMTAFAQKLPNVVRDMAERRYGAIDEAFHDLGEDDPEEDEGIAPASVPSERVRVSSAQPTHVQDDEDLLGPVGALTKPTNGHHVDTEDLLGLAPEHHTAADAVVPEIERPPADWRSRLDVDEKGVAKLNPKNLSLVLQYDSRFFKRFGYNELRNTAVVTTRMTAKSDSFVTIDVHDKENGEPLKDWMAMNIRAILSEATGGTSNGQGYGWPVGKELMNDTLDLVARKRRFHPVKRYLTTLSWDRVERLSTVLQRYFRVEDNPYTREVFRLLMLALVTRVFEPGHKFDLCVVLQGEQGIGKSTFLKMLGRAEWYVNFDCGFDDTKAAVEKLMGALLAEIGEMADYNKSGLDQIKQFLSNTVDRVRLAYAHFATEHPRQAVFVGTVNQREFLRDLTGNRRFLPIECKLGYMEPMNFKAFGEEVDQLWAEAYHVYQEARRLHPRERGDMRLDLSEEAQAIAFKAQSRAQQESEAERWAAEIEAYLDTPIMSTDLTDPTVDEKFDDAPKDHGPAIRMVRARVSSEMIWTEALKREKRDLVGRNGHALRDAMSLVKGWRPSDGKLRFGKLALRGFIRDEFAGHVRVPMFKPLTDDEDLIG